MFNLCDFTVQYSTLQHSCRKYQACERLEFSNFNPEMENLYIIVNFPASDFETFHMTAFALLTSAANCPVHQIITVGSTGFTQLVNIFCRSPFFFFWPMMKMNMAAELNYFNTVIYESISFKKSDVKREKYYTLVQCK
jgi:hypothetical protein